MNTIKRRHSTATFMLLGLLMVSWGTLHADKYAGEIFRMGLGVRNYALGSTGMTDTDGYAAAYWNPALLTTKQGNGLDMMHADEFGGMIKYDTFSGIWGKTEKFGFSLMRIGIDDVPLTRLEHEGLPPSIDNQPVVYKVVNNSDYMAYVGFGRVLNDNLSIGLSPKVAFRTLAEQHGYGFGADFGAHYRITDAWDVGARVSDFFSTQVFWQNSTHEVVNPSLDLENHYRFQILKGKLPIQSYLRVEVLTEGRVESATVAMNPFSLDFHGGLEFIPAKALSLLVGYDVDNLTAGMSLRYRFMELQYAYLHQAKEDLSDCNRIALGVRF